MQSLKESRAVVIGGAGDVGRAVVEALAAEGASVRAVSRNAERLERLKREVKGSIEVLAGDAAEPSVVARSLGEFPPDLLVLSQGIYSPRAPVHEQTWEGFSAAWNNDVKSTFLFGQEALRRLRPGSTVVILSSGAAITGSPLSGGYAGAKRMQWLMASYLQGISGARKLGLRFVALVPRQMIAGTRIADDASAAYAAREGISQEKYMERFGKPLTPQMVAQAILAIARGEAPAGTALGITGTGLEPLA